MTSKFRLTICDESGITTGHLGWCTEPGGDHRRPDRGVSAYQGPKIRGGGESHSSEETMSDALEMITAMGKLMADYDKKIKAHEQAITLLKGARNKLSFKELPKLYEQLGGITEIKIELDSGEEVMVALDRNIHAKMSTADKEHVYSFMTSNGYSHHISTDVGVSFTKGQEEKLKKFVDYLDASEEPVDYSVDSAVHSSTYTAFIKGIVADGYHIDDDKFGVYRQEIVDIHPVKQTVARKVKRRG